MRKNKLIKKLNGFQKAPKDRFLLLATGTLTQEELVLYELGLASTDWDHRHIDTYGTFHATNQEIADILGWKNGATAGRHKANLIKKGFFILADDQRIAPKDFEKWELRKSAKMQNQVAEMQSDSANKHEPSAKIQELSPQNSGYSLISYKGNISSFNNESNTTNNDSGLSEDDKKWIDENVKEELWK